MTPSPLGYVLIAASVLCTATAYHLNKAALATASPAVVVILSQLTATAALLLGGVLWRRAGWRVAALHELTPRLVLRTLRAQGRLVLLATALGALGSWGIVVSTDLYGPALTAFLANLTLVFLVLGGVVLGERLDLPEVLAVVAIVVGAFLFSSRGQEVIWRALALMSVACLCTAGKQLSVRHASRAANLPAVMTGTLLLMALWTSFLLLGEPPRLPRGAGWVWAPLAGVVGSALGMCLLYSGYHRVGVARGAPIDALRPLAVLLIGITLLGHGWPNPIQLAGGALVLGGSVALARLMRRNKPAAESAAASA